MTLTDMVMSLLKEPMSVRMVVNACKERYGEEVLQASVSNVVRRKYGTDELVVVGNTCATGRQAMIYQVNPNYKPKIEHVAKPKSSDREKALECLKQGDYRADNYEDGAAYMALMGEAAANCRA